MNPLYCFRLHKDTGEIEKREITEYSNDGVQHFHRCKGYEKSEEAARLESEFLKFLKERKDGD